jgi:hypothetical protein
MMQVKAVVPGDIIVTTMTVVWGEQRLWIVSVLTAAGSEVANCCATMVPRNTLEQQ